MIRINLLAAAGTRSSWMPPVPRATLAGLAMLLLAATGLSLWWWTLNRSAAALDVRMARSEADLTRLRAAAGVVERAVARKAELSERLALIERLRAAQRGPVTVLATVNRNITDGLWLMELTQRANIVQLEGRATTLTAITDFAERLQGSGTFDRPVEITTASMESVDEASVIRFALKANLFGTTPPPSAAATPKTGH